MLELTVDVRPQLTMLSQLGDDIPDGLERGLKEAAEIGADWLDADLNSVLKKQTPYYRLQITTQPDGPNWKITDRGNAVYNFWLEGVSRRNARTRFRGYSHWRRLRQRLEREARVFVERHIMLALRKAQR